MKNQIKILFATICCLIFLINGNATTSTSNDDGPIPIPLLYPEIDIEPDKSGSLIPINVFYYNEYISFSFSSYIGTVSILIKNLTTNETWQTTINSAIGLGTVDIHSSQPAGIYSVTVTTDNATYSGRFIL